MKLQFVPHQHRLRRGRAGGGATMWLRAIRTQSSRLHVDVPLMIRANNDRTSANPRLASTYAWRSP